MFQSRTLRTILTISLCILALGIVVRLAYASYHYSQKPIGINGGKLTAGDGAPGTKLDIPAGALSQDTLISMEVVGDETSRVDFTFGPAGTVFNQPVSLELSWATLKNVTGPDLILYYYNPDLGQWVEETTAVFNENGKKAILSIDHFSLYYFDRR